MTRHSQEASTLVVEGLHNKRFQAVTAPSRSTARLSVGLKLKHRRPSRKTLPRYGHQSGERAIRLTNRNCDRNSPKSRQLWGIRNYSSNNRTKHTPLNEANFLYKSDEHCHWVKEAQLKWSKMARRCLCSTWIYTILFVSLKLYGMYVFVSCCIMHSCGSNIGACVYCGISLLLILYPFVSTLLLALVRLLLPILCCPCLRDAHTNFQLTAELHLSRNQLHQASHGYRMI